MATIIGANIYIDGVKHNSAVIPLWGTGYDVSDVKLPGELMNVQASYVYDDDSESELSSIQNHKLLLEALQIAYWQNFNYPDGYDATVLGWLTPTTIEGGALQGFAGANLKDIGTPPTRIQCTVEPKTANFLGGMYIRAVDNVNNYYLVRWNCRPDAAVNSFQLYEKVNGTAKLLIEAPVTGSSEPMVHDIEVIDDGTDIIATLLDFGITLRASDSVDFTNAFQGETQLGFYGGAASDLGNLRSIRVYTSEPTYDYITKVPMRRGILEWWTKGMQYFEGVHKRTYVASISPWGAANISYYDHTEGRYSELETIEFLGLSHGKFARDDHNAPGILVDSMGYIYVFVHLHSADGKLLMYKSTNPEDISDFDSPVDISEIGTNQENYPQCYQVSNGEFIMFMRIGDFINSKWQLLRSIDNGSSWTRTDFALDAEDHSLYFMSRQSLIDPDNIVVCAHASYVSFRKDVYLMETSDGGETWRIPSSKAVVSLPLSISNMECAYISTVSRLEGFAIDSNGMPRVLIANNDAPSHEHGVVSWNRSAWVYKKIIGNTVFIDNGTASWYPSGGDISMIDADEIALSVYSGGKFEIQKYRTEDGGATWVKTFNITSDSKAHNFRPFYSNGKLWWVNGEYRGDQGGTGGGENPHWTQYDDCIILNEPLAKHENSRV